jgi:hypothetical protein
MATQDDEAFLKKYGGYKPAPVSVPVTSIKPIIGGETAEEAQARRAREARESRGAEIAEESAARAAREEQRGVESKEFTQIGSIRTEFLGIPEVKEFRQVRNATRQIIDLTSKGTPIANIGSVFSLMKILDPGSTVREGEAASVQNAAGVPDRFRNAYNQLLSGQGLSETQRKDMADVARSIYNQRLTGYNDLATTYRGLMADLGADPDKQGITLETPLEMAGAAGDRATQLQDAFNKGASLQELNALASTLGISPNQDELLKAIEFRDAGGAGARILPPEAGGAPEETGFFEGIVETVTGSERSTPEIEALPEWTTMPELNELSVAGARTGIGTMFTSPEESVKIIQSNYPGVQVRQDSKGNYILRSQDGREYGIKPGFRWSDVPRALGGILAFTPAGRATTVAGAAGGSALTQAGIEATQAGAGGTFDTGEIAIAGGAGAAGKVIEQALPVVVSAVRGMRGGPAAALPETIPVGAAPEAPPTMGMPSPAAMAPEAPLAPAQAAPVAAPMGAPAAGVAEEVVTEAAAPSRFIPTEELDKLIATATKKGSAGKAAQQKIIELAEINPEAKAVAESLGFNLPIDVYADNPQIRAALGLERAQFGTPAQGEWDVTLRKAIDNADDISQQFDALFIGGRPATGAVSQKIKTGLEQSKAALKQQASALYKQVDEGISKNTPVNLDNLFSTLQQVISEVGEGGLNQQEKKLLDLFQTGEAAGGDITYGRLIREKNLIRRAKEGKESPYGSLDEASLARLESALAKDQLDNVERVAGEQTRRNLRAANLLYAKQGALGKRMVSAFGRDLEGDLNSLLLGAIKEAEKGGSRKFTKLLNTVPAEYRKEALATAISSVTRSKGSQGFGFAEFREFYPGLRANPEVFGKIAKEMGPEWVKAMNSLLTVSKRMTEARSVSGLGTGATLQADLRKSLAAQGKLQNFLNSTMMQRVAAGVTGYVPGLSFLVPDMIEWMGTLGKNKLNAAQQLFRDPEFLNALEQSATQGAPSTATVNKLSMSKPFRSYAKAFGISDNPKDWLKATLSATAPQMNEQTQPSSSEGVPMVRTQ